jgi:lysozyme
MSDTRTIIAALTLSAAAFGGLVLSEGYSDTAIIPVKGDVPTLGFGTTEGVKPGDRITPPQAVIRALQDIGKYEGAVKQCVTVPLHQYEYDAFVQLAYNIGPGKEGVADGFCWLKKGGPSTLVRRLNAGDYEGACRAILDWDRFKGQPLKGLTVRRQKEYRTCTGESPSSW